MMKIFQVSAFFVLSSVSISGHSSSSAIPPDPIEDQRTHMGHIGSQTPLTADLALKKLMDGNKRYLAGKATCKWSQTPSDEEKREQLANTQKPFAVILGCSDSRVPPEVIFDQRLGDLFVIRVAGNVIDDVVLGSIEYAVENLSPVPLLFVLGHERCGAVKAAVDTLDMKPSKHDHISSILQKLYPVVQQAKKKDGKDLLDKAITLNIQTVSQKLAHATPYLKEAVNTNRLTIVGGRYDMDTGTITIVTN